MKQNYGKYLKSEAWRKKRTTILKKAGYRCRRCGVRATEVHHENYKRVFNEKLSDLTAICRSCHQKVHTKKRKPRQKRVLKGKTGWKKKPRQTRVSKGKTGWKKKPRQKRVSKGKTGWKKKGYSGKRRWN